MNDRELNASILHFAGTCAAQVPAGVRLSAFLLCDGYGSMDLDTMRELDIVFDWSHVRDSSDKAVANCAFYLREQLGRSGLLRVSKIIAQDGATIPL